jgi:hypothetical protein
MESSIHRDTFTQMRQRSLEPGNDSIMTFPASRIQYATVGESIEARGDVIAAVELADSWDEPQIRVPRNYPGQMEHEDQRCFFERRVDARCGR